MLPVSGRGEAPGAAVAPTCQWSQAQQAMDQVHAGCGGGPWRVRSQPGRCLGAQGEVARTIKAMPGRRGDDVHVVKKGPKWCYAKGP